MLNEGSEQKNDLKESSKGWGMTKREQNWARQSCCVPSCSLAMSSFIGKPSTWWWPIYGSDLLIQRHLRHLIQMNMCLLTHLAKRSLLHSKRPFRSPVMNCSNTP